MTTTALFSSLLLPDPDPDTQISLHVIVKTGTQEGYWTKATGRSQPMHTASN